MKKKKNFFSLSTGLFTKYFGKKKSIKKNKILKILIGKYVRKIFLIIKIKYLFLIIKKNPTFLLEFLKYLNTPIIHKFFNPYKNQIVEDYKNQPHVLRFNYFIFFKNTSFSFQKTHKKGRIKRKISRKLILKNKLID